MKDDITEVGAGFPRPMKVKSGVTISEKLGEYKL